MYALDFSHDHYVALIDRLEEHYEYTYLVDNRGAIKQAIIDIFSDTLQKVTVTIIEEQFHIDKALLYPFKGEQLDRILHKVTMRLLTVEDNPEVFRPVEYLWIIPEDVRRDLFGYFHRLKLNVKEEREYIRERINHIFGLDERDIVLFLRNAIYILNYIPPEIVEEGVDRRYGGHPPEEMDALYDQIFPEGAWDQIDAFLDGVFSDQLDFSRIDNQTFRDIFIQTFKAMVQVVVAQHASYISEDMIEGFSGYVLRKYFDDILLSAAWEVLALFQERDRNAEEFIRYFQDEIIINAKGKKIQKYAIIDEHNQKWNHNSILSILMQYEQSENRIRNQEEKIAGIQSRLGEAQYAFNTERNGRFKFSAEVKEVQNLVVENQNRIDELEHRIEDLKETTDENYTRLNRLKKERETLQERSKLAYNNADYANRRFNNRQVDMKNWDKQLHANEKQLEELTKQHDELEAKVELIAKALAAAMAKR
jgi:predicted  nucleic acid-binding Zn-ribbon protein